MKVSHADIIEAVGVSVLMRALNLPQATVISWRVRDRIPAPYWMKVAQLYGLQVMAEYADDRDFARKAVRRPQKPFRLP